MIPFGASIACSPEKLVTSGRGSIATVAEASGPIPQVVAMAWKVVAARTVTIIEPVAGRSQATPCRWTRAVESDACHETLTRSPSQAIGSTVRRTVGFEAHGGPPLPTARRRVFGRVSG